MEGSVRKKQLMLEPSLVGSARTESTAYAKQSYRARSKKSAGLSRYVSKNKDAAASKTVHNSNLPSPPQESSVRQPINEDSFTLQTPLKMLK